MIHARHVFLLAGGRARVGRTRPDHRVKVCVCFVVKHLKSHFLQKKRRKSNSEKIKLVLRKKNINQIYTWKFLYAFTSVLPAILNFVKYIKYKMTVSEREKERENMNEWIEIKSFSTNTFYERRCLRNIWPTSIKSVAKYSYISLSDW